MILIAALVFIGPSKLPSLARTMGKGMRDLRRAMAGFEDEVRQASTIPEPPAQQSPSKAPVETVPQSDPTTANAEPETEDDAPSSASAGEEETLNSAPLDTARSAAEGLDDDKAIDVPNV